MQHPPRDEAIQLGRKRYSTDDRCPHCFGNRIRYVDGDRCFGCEQTVSRLLHNITLTNWETFISIDGSFHNLYRDGFVDPLADHLAWRIGVLYRRWHDNPNNYKVTENQCPNGHPGLLLINGKCATCDDIAKASPRQQAINAGEKWYTPTKPCKECHQLAPRYVANGTCSGCNPEKSPDKDQRQTADSIMMRDCPDMVISKADAKLAGFKVYRTGNACRRGHAGYRYVSSGHCTRCVNG